MPNRRIVWTNEEGGEAAASVTPVTFEEHDGRTRPVMTERHPSKEAPGAAGLGAQEARHETSAQLDDLLAACAESPTRGR